MTHLCIFFLQERTGGSIFLNPQHKGAQRLSRDTTSAFVVLSESDS